jgi:integrase
MASSNCDNLVMRKGVWYVRVGFMRKRYLRSTKTGKVAEAREFRDAFLRALREGRVDAIEGSKLRAAAPRRAAPRLRDVFARYVSEVALRGRPSVRTAERNCNRLRIVVREALNVVDPDMQPATVLTEELALRFARARLRNVGDEDPEAADAARRTVYSTLTQARSLFKKTLQGAYRDLDMPDTVAGFRDVFVCEHPAKEREEYSMEEVALITRAGAELKTADSALYAVWLLGYYLALRAGEIAAARWSWIEGEPGGREMRICRRPEEGFDPKGYSGWVPIADDVYAELLTVRQDGHPWIVPLASHNRRYSAVVKGLAAWMRSRGWGRAHCAHELRAYRAQQWRMSFGRDVMRDWLRHSTVEVGLKHYTTNHNTSARPTGLNE